MICKPSDARQRGLVTALGRLGAGEAVRDPDGLAARLLSPEPWDAPLDASRLETLASPSVLPRIAETLTRMIVEHEAGGQPARWAARPLGSPSAG